MKYELTFNEALDVLINNKGWVQGEHFADGVVLIYGTPSICLDLVYLRDFNLPSCTNGSRSPLQITRGVLSQKYRVVTTQPDAERKL